MTVTDPGGGVKDFRTVRYENMVDEEKRPRGRPSTVDRQRAIQAAMESYWRRGISDLSLNEVCRIAGLSKPALYRAFGGEDGLHAAVLAQYREQVVQPMLKALEADAPFARVLDAAIVALTSDRGTPAGCLFTKMRLAGERLGPATAELVRDLEAEHRRAYEAWFRRAVAAGEANADLSPKLAARYLDTQLAAVLVQMGLGVSSRRIRAQARLAVRPLLAPGDTSAES